MDEKTEPPSGGAARDGTLKSLARVKAIFQIAAVTALLRQQARRAPEPSPAKGSNPNPRPQTPKGTP